MVLLSIGEPQKILFTGHRGTGKSTELSKLAATLQSHWVVRFSVNDKLDVADLKHVDILFSIALQMLKKMKEDEINIPPNLERRINSLEANFITETVHTNEAGVEVKAGIAEKFLNLFSIEGRLKAEHSTRDTVRKTISPRLSEVNALIEEISDVVRDETRCEPLVICEDIDKADLDTAVELFKNHSATLTSFAVSAIYTFPIALQNNHEAAQIITNFSDKVALPNFRVTNKNGTDCIEIIEQIEKIVEDRVDGILFKDTALRKIAKASGGIPRTLIRLARDACLQAGRNFNGIIEDTHVDQAIEKERRNFQRILGLDQLNELKDIHATKSIDPRNPKHLELLDNLSVLEYENGGIWYDVNPVILPLLP